MCVVVSSSVPKRLTRTTIVLTRLYFTQRVRKNMRYNRYCLRLWIRCWSSPYLFSLILSLTIEIYFSPINKLHSVPQVLIPILIEMFFVVFLLGFPSFSFSCVVPCSHALCNFGSIEKTWAVPYFSKWHIISWWSWWESHPCLIRYPLRSSNKFLYICRYLYYPLLLKWYASQIDFNLRI